MEKFRLTLPEISLIASTRAALGGGLGLLLAERLNKKQCRTVGWTLLLLGAFSTIPLGILVFSKRRKFPFLHEN